MRVLVVEDDFMIAQLHARCVEQEPECQLVGMAPSCNQALSMTQQLKPDLVVLDVYLPDKSGLEVVRAARADGIHCDFILITAAKEIEVIEEAFRLGIFDYLIKPFGLDLLRESLQKFLQFQARLRSSNEHDQSFVEGLKSLRPVRAAQAQAPKGIDARTLERIERILRAAAEPSSVELVAQSAGVSRPTARAYLNHLVKQGAADTFLRYGAVGRPQVFFCMKG
jgi:response regulator of citrate/malate metabolism